MLPVNWNLCWDALKSDVYFSKLAWFGNVLTNVLSIQHFLPRRLSIFDQTKAIQLFNAEAIGCRCGNLILHAKTWGRGNLIQTHKYVTQQCARETQTSLTNVVVRNASGRSGLFRLDTCWCFPGADDRGSDGSVCLDLNQDQFNPFLYRITHIGKISWIRIEYGQDTVCRTTISLSG